MEEECNEILWQAQVWAILNPLVEDLSKRSIRMKLRRLPAIPLDCKWGIGNLHSQGPETSNHSSRNRSYRYPNLRMQITQSSPNVWCRKGERNKRNSLDSLWAYRNMSSYRRGKWIREMVMQGRAWRRSPLIVVLKQQYICIYVYIYIFRKEGWPQTRWRGHDFGK